MGGDCEYANSSPVTATKTSANEIKTNCGSCHSNETEPRQLLTSSEIYICKRQAKIKLNMAHTIPAVNYKILMIKIVTIIANIPYVMV